MSIEKYLNESLSTPIQFNTVISLHKDIMSIWETNDDHIHHLVRVPNNTLDLNETTVDKMLATHTHAGYIVLSAYRGENSVEENNIATKQLKKDIASSKYSFIPVWGGFSEIPRDEDGNEIKGAPRNEQIEKSFIITNFPKGKNVPLPTTNDLFELGMTLSKKFNQESFLYKPSKGSKFYDEDNTNTAFWINQQGEIDGTPMKNASPTTNADNYFTRLSKSHRDVIDHKDTKTGDTDTAKRDKSFTYEGVLYFENNASTIAESRGRRGGEQFLFFKIDSYIKDFRQKYGI